MLLALLQLFVPLANNKTVIYYLKLDLHFLNVNDVYAHYNHKLTVLYRRMCQSLIIKVYNPI